MHKRRLTYCMLLAGMLMIPAVQAQTVHPYGLEQMLTVSDDELNGTPRFVGMAGAMTAVGGDPSAVRINPAGLGVYRHSQFSISVDGAFRKYMQPESSMNSGWISRWKVAQASYVFALTHPERVAGIVSNNFMISYNKRTDIYRNILLNEHSGRPSYAQNWIQTGIDEYLYRYDLGFHYAMNISNTVYWGLGLAMEWLQARQTIDRLEYTAEDKRGQTRTYDLQTTVTGRAFGVGGSLGILVHPIRPIRFGLSVESPVVGRMRETDSYREESIYPGDRDIIVVDTWDNPDNISWRMTTPLKASAGLGLQWKNHGLLSLQYDMQYHKLSGVSHTARAGMEVAMTNHWMMDLGYAYSTLYAHQHASLGVQYMGRWLRVGLAYSFSWSTGKVVDSVYYTEQGTYRALQNKVVLSFQWNT